MKIVYVSDVHVEHWRTVGNRFVIIDKIISDCIKHSADVLVVAGDLDSFEHITMSMKYLCTTLNLYDINVVYVPGNHEYYGAPEANISTMLLESLCLEHQMLNLFLPELGFCKIGDFEFHGRIGWIDESYKQIHFPKDSPEYVRMRRQYNDFNYIKWFDRTKLIGKEDSASLFNELTLTDVPKIVVTHFMPCKELIAPKWIGSSLNGCFANDWIGDIPDVNIRAWIYGHTHEASRRVFRGIEFCCNPVGYPFETSGYHLDMIIIEKDDMI